MAENKGLLTEDEMLCCSLIGKYPFDYVRDIIYETCLHQDEKTLARILKVVEGAEFPGYENANYMLLGDEGRRDADRTQIEAKAIQEEARQAIIKAIKGVNEILLSR